MSRLSCGPPAIEVDAELANIVRQFACVQCPQGEGRFTGLVPIILADREGQNPEKEEVRRVTISPIVSHVDAAYVPRATKQVGGPVGHTQLHPEQVGGWRHHVTLDVADLELPKSVVNQLVLEIVVHADRVPRYDS